MTWLLDTNVVSELMRPRPDVNVREWVRVQSPLDLWLSVMTLGELEKGLAALAWGQRHEVLSQWMRDELPRQFVGRLLPVDAAVALAWGQLAGRESTKGRPLPVIDGLLLATASVAGLTLVTRNVRDCMGRGVAVYDPWTATHHT